MATFCPHCGEDIAANADFCPECGDSLADRSPVCPGCGEKNDFGAKHCRKCGADLAVPDDLTLCPHCDATVRRSDLFCASCGGMLSSTTPGNYRRAHVVVNAPAAAPAEKDAEFRRDPFVALLLCLLLGMFGMHRFYLGDVWEGRCYFVMSVFFCWTFICPAIILICCIVDFFRLSGNCRDDRDED